MFSDSEQKKEFYEGLKIIAEHGFPKYCVSCKAVYSSLEDFINKTKAEGEASGLKQGDMENVGPVVELFRSCPCGDSLMEVFRNRRDMSEKGLKRRQKFSELLTMLMDNGMERDEARRELMLVVRGEESKLVKW